MYFFCFFKRKTAYGMRFSDWSSDVCSSDLAKRGGPGNGGRRSYFGRRTTDESPCPCVAQERRARSAGQDRKSGVQGKSVSVRVDVGGRRNIKKKRNIKRNTTTRTND